MDNLSEINVSTPDHVCVISNDSSVTFSIKKGARTMDLKFALAAPIADLIEAPDTTKQIHPAAPVKMLVSKITKDSKTGRRGNPKLTESDVREIKEILNREFEKDPLQIFKKTLHYLISPNPLPAKNCPLNLLQVKDTKKL